MSPPKHFHASADVSIHQIAQAEISFENRATLIVSVCKEYAVTVLIKNNDSYLVRAGFRGCDVEIYRFGALRHWMTRSLFMAADSKRQEGGCIKCRKISFVAD